MIDETTAVDPQADEEVQVSRLIAVSSEHTLVFEQRGDDGAATAGLPEGADVAIVAPQGKSNSSARHELAPKRARYSMLRLLGRGAMGEVHVARDEDLLRKVAFKRMAPDMLRSTPLAARFINEAQVTAQLDHPHIVPVYGVEVGADGTPGYSMKLVQGRTLSAIIADATTGLESAKPEDVTRGLAERLELFLKVCDAMAFAHGKGVLHRDLKPDNIMVGRYNEVYVMDWGICRLVRSAETALDATLIVAEATSPDQRTHVGAIMGTPCYMSPEQAHGQNATLDGRSDLYTLGLILYEIAALKRARNGATLEEVLAQAADGVTPALAHRDKRFGIPRELGGIVAKATAPARERRYASVRELADDLRRYLRGEAVTAAPDTRFQAAARWVGRHRSRALAMMAALLLLAAGAVIVSLIQARVALARAAQEERTTERFLSAAQGQAHVIDDRFFRKERLLAELASHAAEAVANADPRSATRTYFSDDFASPASAPPDLASSEFYGRPISLEWPVVKLAPGVERSAVERDVRVLGLLRPALRTAIEEGVDGTDRSTEALRARFAASGGEIVRAFVSLENGVHMSYPGVAGYRASYDPRTRPKYLLAAHQRGIRWGNPYRDPFGLGTMLPASTALYGTDGEFLGVAGIVTTFDHIRDTLLGLPGQPGVEEALLVDDDGRVVTATKDEGERARQSQVTASDEESEPPIELPPLRFSAVRNAIEKKGSGHIELDTVTGRRIVTFYRLSSLGWYYVVVADPERLTPATVTFSAVGRARATS